MVSLLSVEVCPPLGVSSVVAPASPVLIFTGFTVFVLKLLTEEGRILHLDKLT